MSGYIFESGGCLYRAVHPNAKADIEALFSSGLYHELISQELLVPHQPISQLQSDQIGLPNGRTALKVLTN